MAEMKFNDGGGSLEWPFLPEEHAPGVIDPSESLAAQLRMRLGVVELEDTVAELKRRITPGSFTTLLVSLGVDDIEVKKHIPVTILPDDKEFTATFFDANISTGGRTEQEAIGNLQSLIAEMFVDHMSESPETLGPQMLVQHRVLMDCLCQKSQKTMRLR